MTQAVAITKNTAELERLEGIIRRNLQSFYEVGRALMEIRDSGLYRDVLGFDTFEAYCKDRWDFNSSRARQLIMSVEAIENVKSVTTVTPNNERQTRPLARLEPDQQREAWARAVETAPEGRVTAAHVRKIVRGMVEPDRKAPNAWTVPQPKIKINEPYLKPEPVSHSFKEAYDRMVVELTNASAMKWKETSRKGAMELIRSLYAIAEQITTN